MNQPNPQNATPNRTPLYAAISVIGALGGTAAIGYYAVAEWMQPITPLVMAATTILLPLLAVNSVIALVLSAKHASVARTLQKPVLLSLIMGLLAVGAGASWNGENVRKRALDQAAKQGMRASVIGGLEDPSPKIVARSCAYLFQMGIGGQRQELLELLDRRPVIARSCLTHAKSADGVADIGQVLTERWHREILAKGAPDPGRHCKLAGQLGKMPRAASAGIPALLSCSLQAPSSQVRQCCTRRLKETAGTGEELADTLGNTIVTTVAESLAAPLVQASLHQLQLEDKVRARYVRMGLTKPEMRRYVAGFACAYTLGRNRTTPVTDQLAAWLDSRSCSSDIAAVDQNINAWHRVCGYILDNFEETDAPADLICSAARSDALIEGVETAKTQLKSALAGAQHQFMEAQILAGVALQRHKRRGALSLLEQMRQSQGSNNPELAAALERLDDPEFRKRVEKIVLAASSMKESERNRKLSDTTGMKMGEQQRKQIEAQIGEDKADDVEAGLERLRKKFDNFDSRQYDSYRRR